MELLCYTHKVLGSGDYVDTRISSRILPDGPTVQLQAQCLPLSFQSSRRFSGRREVQADACFLRFLDDSGIFFWLKSTGIVGKA